MTKASDNPFPSVLLVETDDGSIATPDTGEWRLFVDTDNLLKLKNDAGTVTGVGGMANPMTTAGDIIYGGASGTPTRLAIGTAGQVLKVNAGATAPEWDDESGGGGGGEPDCKEAFCTADTAIASATTWTDVTGMSLSLGAGTWDVCAYIVASDANAGATAIELGIHDGSAVVSVSAASKQTGAGQRIQVFASKRITLGSTTTVKAQVASDRGSSSTTVRTTVTWITGGVANTACRIWATKVTAA